LAPTRPDHGWHVRQKCWDEMLELAMDRYELTAAKEAV
jgi:hypothetical protein